MKIPSIRGFNLILVFLILHGSLFSQKKWGKEDLSVYRKEAPFVAIYVEKLPFHLHTKVIRSFDSNGIILAKKDIDLFRNHELSRFTASNNFKLSTFLLNSSAHKQNDIFSGIIQVLDTSQRGIEDFKIHGFKWIIHSKGIATISNFPNLELLLNHPNIIWIDIVKPIFWEGFNGFVDLSIHQIEQFQALTNFNFLPIISIREGMIDENDIDLNQQLVKHSQQPTNISVHTTEMATIIAGSGNSFMNAKGVLPGAKFLVEPLFSFFPLMNDEISSPIQLNSYGSILEWQYTLEAKTYDEYIYDTKKLFVFSSGNNGVVTPHEGFYKDIPLVSNLTGSFKQAKNILLIGGVDAFYSPLNYSSSGPAFDGRLKPELVTIADNGTSVAAAIAVGISSGVFANLPVDLHRNDLVKSILIASSKDIHLRGIDFKTGYGLVDAKKAVLLAQNKQYFINQIIPKTIQNHTFEIPAGKHYIKIALVWNDPAANVNSDKTLVNDLDFYLNKNGNIIHPWILSKTANVDSLNSSAIRHIDTLNNVEFISDTLSGGIYELTVDGSKILQSQEYSIAYSIIPTDHFMFTHPIKDAVVLQDMNQYIRWETDFVEKEVLYYKNVENTNNGWIQVDTVNTNFPIAMFNDFSIIGKYQLKMRIGENDFFSDTFLVMPSVEFNKQYQCDDEIMFKVSSKSQTSISHTLQYFDKELNEWLNTQITTDSFFLQTIDRDYWWRVKNEYAEKNIYPTPAIFIKSDDQQCYQGAFLVEGNQHNVKLNFKTWSNHYIDKIEFQKEKDFEWKTIHFKHNIGVGDHEFFDDFLVRGANIYRALLFLKNGQVVETVAQKYYYIEEDEFWVYPNPVKLGQSLQVIMKDPLHKIIQIYTNEGRMIKSIKSNDYNTTIQIPSLVSGIYYISMLKNNELLSIKRIIVQ